MKSWSDTPTTQMTIFVLFVSTGVLFDGAFSLWASLIFVTIIAAFRWSAVVQPLEASSFDPIASLSRYPKIPIGLLFTMHYRHSGGNWQVPKIESHVRSSHQRCFIRTDVLKTFTKFTGKHLCQSPFCNKGLIGLQLY